VVVGGLGLHLQLHGQAFGLLLDLLAAESPPWEIPSWVVELVSWQPHHCLGARGVHGPLGEVVPPEGSEELGDQGLHSRESLDNWPDRVVVGVLEVSHS
jgi:hypothetical protein